MCLHTYTHILILWQHCCYAIVRFLAGTLKLECLGFEVRGLGLRMRWLKQCNASPRYMIVFACLLVQCIAVSWENRQDYPQTLRGPKP